LDTISYLCGECHGKFHPNPNLGGSREVGVASFTIWRRHPADIAFSAIHGGFAGSEFQGYVTYSLESPVAYFNPTGKEKVVDADSIVMCLSCHRAHASNFSDALRWDYANITTGDTVREGCLTCHTNKGGHP
jgi:predicted CXXCH cytochrome family protein